MKKMYKKSLSQNQNGNILVELLLSVAIAMLIIPFVFKYQRSALERRENIAVTKQMTEIQNVLERYIIENRQDLLKPHGRNIIRVNISELAEYGLDDAVINDARDKYQLRVIKANDFNGQSSLQGVVVYDSDKITPFRTHQILNLSDGRAGFVDGNRAYGVKGTWRTSVADLGIDTNHGIVNTTKVNRDNALYLWRVPTNDPDDATMLSGLNLGEHNVLNVQDLHFVNGDFNEYLTVSKLSVGNLIFDNRTTISKTFETKNATVSGPLTADSRDMDISGRLSLSDTGKFSSFTTNDLFVTNLTLPYLTIDNPNNKPVILTVNGSMQMRYGGINAMQVTVGYSGSVTPSLIVNNKITDASNPNYYWDASKSSAVFADLYLADLNRMVLFLQKSDLDSGTIAGQTFSMVVNNANATVSDYLNALNTISAKVRAKYSLLKLQ